MADGGGGQVVADGDLRRVRDATAVTRCDTNSKL